MTSPIPEANQANTKATSAQNGDALISLQRSVSLPLLLFYGLGTILGAGIYVLIGQVAGLAGQSAPLSFLIAAIVAGFTGFT